MNAVVEANRQRCSRHVAERGSRTSGGLACCTRRASTSSNARTSRISALLSPARLLALFTCLHLLFASGIAGGGLSSKSSLEAAAQAATVAAAPDAPAKRAPTAVFTADALTPPTDFGGLPCGDSQPGEGSEDTPEEESDDSEDDLIRLDSQMSSDCCLAGVGLDATAKTPSQGAKLVFGIYRPPRRA